MFQDQPTKIHQRSLVDLKAAERTAIERLLNWQHGGTSFSSDLFNLMVKADTENFRILAEAYPMEACALIVWRNARSSAEFFAQYGLELHG